MEVTCLACGGTNPHDALTCRMCHQALRADTGTVPKRRPQPDATRVGRSPREVSSPARVGSVEGIVTGLQERSEEGISGRPLAIWTFRLDSFDQSGNLAHRVPVELRGFNIVGLIRDGDLVRIDRAPRRGETMNPTWLFNLTTNSPVVVKTARSRVPAMIAVLAGVLLAAVAGFSILASMAVDLVRRDSQNYEQRRKDEEAEYSRRVKEQQDRFDREARERQNEFNRRSAESQRQFEDRRRGMREDFDRNRPSGDRQQPNVGGGRR